MNPLYPQPGPQTPRRLPSKDTLDYVKVGVELLLLLLAIPWVLRELIRNPARASRKAAAKHALGG